jgi:lysozyme family protein
MRDNFARVLPLLFADEGGYCNDAGDPGGPTKWGIIYDDLVVWRGCKRGAPLAARIAAVKAVDQAEAAAIYKAKYWDSLRCDDLPAGVDYAVFDFGVNSGIGRAAKYLQGVVGAKIDGVIGGMTLKAVGVFDPVKIIDQLSARRMSFLEGLRTWRLFGRGWKARVLHVHADALNMVRATSVPIVRPEVAAQLAEKVKAAGPLETAAMPAFVVPKLVVPKLEGV